MSLLTDIQANVGSVQALSTNLLNVNGPINATGTIYTSDDIIAPNGTVVSNNLYASGTVLVGTTLQSNDTTLIFGPSIFFPAIGTVNANKLRRSTSSRLYKTDIHTLSPETADRVLELRPIRYRSLCEGDNKDWSHYGLIAEEVAEIDPRLVHYGYLDDAYETIEDNGTKKQVVKAGHSPVPNGVAYERLSVLLLDVVKRQDAAIKTLQAEVAALQTAGK